MNKLIKITTVALATTLIATSINAQDKKSNAEKSRNKKIQEIIIRKKDGKTDKMTIIVEDDNVTINGKPVEEFDNGDVTVLRRERPVIAPIPPVRSFRRMGPTASFENFDHLIPSMSNRAMLGVMTRKAEDGVRVTEVTKESAAEKAGLKKDDVITKVGSTEIEEPGDLTRAIGEYKPNDKVEITYKRDGKENKTFVTLGENTKSFSFDMHNGDFNFDMENTPLFRGEDFNFNFNRRPKIGMQIQDLEEGKGVSVKDVDDESPAAKAGIKEGDVITQVNGKDVEGVDELRTSIKDIKEGETIKFGYKRGGKSQTADIKIPKRLKSADL